jgi:hypothetical protein
MVSRTFLAESTSCLFLCASLEEAMASKEDTTNLRELMGERSGGQGPFDGWETDGFRADVRRRSLRCIVVEGGVR